MNRSRSHLTPNSLWYWSINRYCSNRFPLRRMWLLFLGNELLFLLLPIFYGVCGFLHKCLLFLLFLDSFRMFVRVCHFNHLHFHFDYIIYSCVSVTTLLYHLSVKGKKIVVGNAEKKLFYFSHLANLF